jgi:uncharacterized protein
MGDTPNQAAKPSTQKHHSDKKPNNLAAKKNQQQTQPKQSNQMMGTAFADAFAKAKK